MKNRKLLLGLFASILIMSIISCDKYKKFDVVEKCVKIVNPEIGQTKNETWELKSNDRHLMFFPNKKEAEQTLAILKIHGLGKHCQCGEGRYVNENGEDFEVAKEHDDHIMQYQLMRGDVGLGNQESGLEFEDCMEFNPNKLRARGKTMIEGFSHAMFTFNSHKECVDAIKIIKKYGFNQTCFIGRPNASFTYLRKK